MYRANNETIVKPIFQAMINNLPDIMVKKIFFEVGEKSYFSYLPQNIRDDQHFVKEAINKEMVNIFELPEEFKTSKYVSKSQYIALIKEESSLLSLNIYPQDSEIVLAALSNTNNDIFDLIEPEFRKNEELLIEAIKKVPDHLYHIEPSLAQKFRKNIDVMSVLIDDDPQMFHELKNKEKSESVYLKLMLKNLPRFNEAKDFLSSNKDPDIALMAVKLTKKSIPYLHQNFQKIIEKSENQKDVYTFLKIQLLNEKNRNSNNGNNGFKNK